MPHAKPITRRTSRCACLLFGLLTLLAAHPAAALPIGNVVVSELMFDPNGNDNGRQWIEIYNGESTPVDLSQYTLAWGRNNLANSVALDAVFLAPFTTFVIGGPNVGNYNANPVYDQIHNFGPNLGDGGHGSQEDAVALIFEPTTTVVHTVVYGGNGIVTAFTDEQGATAVAVDLSGLGQGDSLEYQGGSSWLVQGAPTPGGVPVTVVPEPNTALLVGLGLIALSGARRR